MFPIARKYKMSDGSLADCCMRLVMGARRDLAELGAFGWTEARITAIADLREAFADLPTDAELSGMMSEATAAKNLVRKNAVEFATIEIMLRVSQHYGEGSPTYNRFRAKELYSSSDHQCWLVLKRVHRQGTMLLADLAPEGLTVAHLNTLADYITALNAALLAQDEAIDNRDRAVQKRIEVGNMLYDEMVKLAEVGKRIWLNVDESRYNEYVLYPKTGDTEPEGPMQVFESEVSAETVLNLSVTNVQGSHTIEAHNTGTTSLYVYFAAHPTDLPDATVAELEASKTITTTATAAGFLAGVREYLNVYNPDTGPGNIEVTVSG